MKYEIVKHATSFQQALEKFALEMRRRPTPSERQMCRRLEDHGIRYRLQEIVGWYIADILIPSKLVIIEMDGKHHYTRQGRQADRVRTAWLQRFGFEIIRVVS